MPIGRRATLGAAQHGADGTFREPPWSTDCQPWQCAAAPESAITAQMRADCPFWGPRGTLSCAAAGGFCNPWCTAAAAPAAAAYAPPAAGPVMLNLPPENQPAPLTQQDQKPAAVPVTVETIAGPVTVSSDFVPGNTDMALTPVQVRIPNIWDLLDPTRASQFEYRGLSTALPVWISLEYRRAQAAKIAAAVEPSGGMDLGGVPWWVWLAVGGTAYYLGDKPKRRVARGR